MALNAYRRRRQLLALVLALLCAFWIQPSHAFDSVPGLSRPVSAQVVANAGAYHAISGGSCPDVLAAGGSCTFVVTNKGTGSSHFTVTRESDPRAIVGSYKVSNGTPVASGPVTTPAALEVGYSTTLTATLTACASCVGQSIDVYWTVQGQKAGVLDSQVTSFRMSITYR